MTGPEEVERIVEETLGNPVRTCEKATGGRVAQTYLVELEGEPARVACKIGGPSVRTGDVIEPLVVALVTETTTVQCPSLLGSGRIYTDGDRDTHWALYEFREGQPPTPFQSLGEPRQRRIVHQTGSMLGQLHATHQFERTGGLGRAGDTLVVQEPAGLYVPERGRDVAKRYPGCSPDRWQPVLTHGDLFPGNLLVDGEGAVTAFLDWGNAHVTTAGYALARAELRFVDWFRFDESRRSTLEAALREGYTKHRTLPPDYATLGRFYKLLWLGQSADRILRHLTNSRGRAQLRRHLSGLFPTSLQES